MCLHPRPTWPRSRRCTAAATSSHMQQAALGWALRAPIPRQHARSCVSYACSCTAVATCVCTPDPPGRGRGAARRLRQAAACSKPRLGGLCELSSPGQHAKSCVSCACSRAVVATCVCPPDPPGRGRGAAQRLQQVAACSKPRRGGLCELRSPDSTPSPASATPPAAPWWRPASAPPTHLVAVAALHGGCNEQPYAASRAGVGSVSSAPQTAR
jgi:hypothetical protein